MENGEAPRKNSFVGGGISTPVRQASVISNEDLVVIAATPLGSGPTPAAHRTPKATEAASPVANCDRVVLTFTGDEARPRRLQTLRKVLCNKRLLKVVCGLLVTAAMASSWVGATHFVKRTYLYRRNGTGWNSTLAIERGSASKTRNLTNAVFYAPFFTTWVFTAWLSMFFPLYVVAKSLFGSEKNDVHDGYQDSLRTFRERGFTASKFFTRSAFLCALWVATNYMYVHSLRILDATDVMSLYSSNVSFVYLLSWVILHYQFVGVRIVAVILCNTGIALLAYMDGLTKTPTLGGVLLGAAASAGSAIFKVVFKKLIGEANFSQVALFFTVISLFNMLLLWPIVVTLYLAGAEVIQWPFIPWLDLVAGAGLALVTNLLGNFGIAVTYEVFITLGLVVAVPISADIKYNNVTFVGMKLSGNILIAIGFMLVLFPSNWPDLLFKLIRLHRRRPVEETTGLDASGGRSRLRSPNGLIR